MTTPSKPTRTRQVEHPEGMQHGKGQDGYTTTQPTPRDRRTPETDADPGLGGGWGRQSGEGPVDGPDDGDGY